MSQGQPARDCLKELYSLRCREALQNRVVQGKGAGLTASNRPFIMDDSNQVPFASSLLEYEPQAGPVHPAEF